jgi:hypothetical protein
MSALRHRAIQVKLMPPMDPRQDILFRPFWQPHFYIDDLFATTLQQ